MARQRPWRTASCARLRRRRHRSASIHPRLPMAEDGATTACVSLAPLLAEHLLDVVRAGVVGVRGKPSPPPGAPPRTAYGCLQPRRARPWCGASSRSDISSATRGRCERATSFNLDISVNVNALLPSRIRSRAAAVHARSSASRDLAEEASTIRRRRRPPAARAPGLHVDVAELAACATAPTRGRRRGGGATKSGPAATHWWGTGRSRRRRRRLLARAGSSESWNGTKAGPPVGGETPRTDDGARAQPGPPRRRRSLVSRSIETVVAMRVRHATGWVGGTME